jgi:DNA-binding NarL/FixJ family response regulator
MIIKIHSAIVLTTSSNSSDLLQCYRIGIAGYILKPLKYDEYVDRITKLVGFN